MSRKTFWRIVWWYTVLCFWAKPPLYAQTIPADFHGWFLQHVAGKPFGQQTLLELAPLLPCVGSQITPPNAVGERTKLWDPTTQRWTRVGFGEGYWVWIAQSDGLPPMIEPCNVQPAPSPTPPSRDDQYAVTLLRAIYDQNERIFKAEAERFDHLDQQGVNLAAQLKQHDEEPSWIRKHWPDVLTVIGSFAGGWYVAK